MTLRVTLELSTQLVSLHLSYLAISYSLPLHLNAFHDMPVNTGETLVFIY